MILLLFLICLPAAQLQDLRDLQDHCPDGSCNPPLGDLMVGRAAQLSASSTCGLDDPQNYCIIGYLEGEQKCFTCDSRLPYNRYSNPNSHRIENVITTFDPERRMKWWQSENGVHHVSVRLDLETVFQFSHLVLTFKSFRPAAMLVERSKDFGRSWKVFRYFAEDCLLHFPLVSDGPADGVDDIVCDGRYSGSEPSTGGEVVLKALDPVFEIENPYAANIQDLITVTNIRVNFTRLFTLGDTLLTRRRRNPQDKYYYSLYNMVVRGSCFCNGHAAQCTPVDGARGDVFTQPGMVHGRCVCQHNTAGENCERCQEFHHDSPWRPGGENTADICRRCNCHGHSDSCHFDAARYELTSGVSGGVCHDCRHDRSGPQCEQCRPFMYQDPQRTMDNPHACIPCDCDPAGSRDDGLCDALSGQCICKEHVEGQRCDRCKHGFFGLQQDDPAGCQVCSCHALGSVGSCDQLTGSCECDHLASGPLCDRCVEGFWGLGDSGFRCSPCNCDIGGAHGNTCSPVDGQCHCLPNMIGRRCSDPAPGYFLPSLDYFLYEAELAAPLSESSTSSPSPPSSSSLLNPVVLPQCEKYFREQGFDFQVSEGRVILVRRSRRLVRRRRHGQQNGIPLDPGHALQIIPRQRSRDQPVIWTGLGLVRVLEGAGLRFTVDNLPSSIEYQLVIRYEPESPSDWLASVSIIALSPGDGGCSSNPTGSKTLVLPGNSRGGVLESPLCLNSGSRYFMDMVFHKQPRSRPGSDGSHILIDSMGLIPSIQSVPDLCSQTHVDTFRRLRCTGLAAELGSEQSLPEVCEGFIKSLSARVHNGAVPCSCNLIGSLGPACSKVGGFCECKANVIGRCCDSCAPLTFGLGPDGCRRCECHVHGSLSELCDQVTGRCPCRPEVTGRRCDHCHTGFWGFPSCQSCECNGLSETCDGDTGQCMNCREHSTGPNCDRCEEGYYGNPVDKQPCQPCLCPDDLSSGRFFAVSCQHDPQSRGLTCICQEGHTGVRCDRCSPGFYGDLTLPGTRCSECPCNNNVDPDDREACDGTTGECRRCLHNTTGPRCENCKPGYYGNALDKDCKECSCDRRGTQVTQCPLGSPCFCDARTGQCPCRMGVAGDLCDECEDGYWNLDGASCQSCNCDPVNSFSNICNKVTGQCLCRPEFGGRQCDECGENHFGNPDLQCISCDCNLEGTERPSCDPETGECICRVGITGIFCDECAAGYGSAFPACEECHPCTALWTEDVTDVQRAAQRMRTFIPRHDDEPADGHHWQQMLEMHSKLDSLANLTLPSLPKLEKAEKLLVKIRKLKDAIDPNVILIDPSPLLNTEIDNIQREFKKLLNGLKEKLGRESNNEGKEQLEELQEIQDLHGSFMSDEDRVRNASKAVEDSMDTRQDAKRKLSTCSSGRGGDLAPLEKKVKELSVVKFNQKICGEPGLEDCSGCGGALCGLGNSRCGGPSCDGVVPLSQKASEMAQRAKDQLLRLPSRLQESKNKIHDIKRAAQDSRDQARDLQDRILSNNDAFEREKNKTRELIQRVKQYLMDDMVPPADIENMAQAVLNIKLPRSPDMILSMIHDINNLLHKPTTSQEDLKNLKHHAATAQDLLEEAWDLRDRTKTIDVTEITGDIYDAERAQDKANDHLEMASRDRDQSSDRINDTGDKLDGVEANLKNQPEDLLQETDTVKTKTERNRETARDARDAAQSAGNTATDAQTDLVDVMNLYEMWKQKQQDQSVEAEAAKRLKDIMKEADDTRRRLEDRLSQIQGLEQRIQQLLQKKTEKSSEVSELMEVADSLRQEISRRAEGYTTCTS